MSGCALGNPVKWKEEVLLHNGQRIIVERSQTTDPKALREPFKEDPISEVGLVFSPPGTDQKIEWKSDWGPALQGNLYLLLLDFKNDIPYIATIPSRCHAYNTWGRPNPPYVFFKYDAQAWQRIPLEEFPEEFKDANVIINTHFSKKKEKEIRSVRHVTAERIGAFNKDMHPDTKYLRQLARQPIATGDGEWRCPVPSGPKRPVPLNQKQ